MLHTHKLFHRSFFTEKLLSTGAFTHRRLYTQKLVHTEAFTHRSFYTEKPLHTDAFPQKNRFHRAAFTHFKDSQFYVGIWRSAIISCERFASGVGKSQFLTLDNHFAWKGRAWPCKIAILHRFISREAVVPDVPKWNFTPILERLHLTLKNLSFPTVIAVWLSCHACIWTFKITSLHQFLMVDPDFVRRGCAGPHQICILPRVWMSDLRDLCGGLPVP